MKIAVIIPARYQSSRLPGKPLVKLCGVPMLVRTFRQCAKAVSAHEVYVATDDDRIAEVCRNFDMQYLMTSPECLTGTDRIAEAAGQLDADIFINVQGDEPVFNPEDIVKLIDIAKRYPDEVHNGFCEITEEEQFRSSSVPKVVLRPDGRLLYMSRAPIPTNKKHGFAGANRQVCAYAFPRAALAAFSAQKEKTPLEQIEDIEILRFLELGCEVRMLQMSSKSVAVDNPQDIETAEEAIRKMGL